MKIEWFADKLIAKITDDVDKIAAEVATNIAVDAKTFCPEKTGTAKASIRMRKSKFDGWTVRAGGKGEWGDAWYFPKIELGTKKIPNPPAPLTKALEMNKTDAKRRFGAK